MIFIGGCFIFHHTLFSPVNVFHAICCVISFYNRFLFYHILIPSMFWTDLCFCYFCIFFLLWFLLYPFSLYFWLCYWYFKCAVFFILLFMLITILPLQWTCFERRIGIRCADALKWKYLLWICFFVFISPFWLKADLLPNFYDKMIILYRKVFLFLGACIGKENNQKEHW